MVVCIDNIDVGNTAKGGIPFSMSGDGLKDIEIPSVFVKKPNAIFLQSLVQEAGEVLIEMALGDQPGQDEEGDDKPEEPSENVDGKNEEDSNFEDESEMDKKNSEDIQTLSRKVQSLLEELNVDELPDELKESVSKELGKLKALNLNPQSSGSDSCSATSKEDLMKTVVDQLGALKDSYSGKPLRISQKGEITGETGSLEYELKETFSEEGVSQVSAEEADERQTYENESERTSGHGSPHGRDMNASSDRECPGPG